MPTRVSAKRVSTTKHGATTSVCCRMVCLRVPARSVGITKSPPPPPSSRRARVFRGNYTVRPTTATCVRSAHALYFHDDGPRTLQLTCPVGVELGEYFLRKSCELWSMCALIILACYVRSRFAPVFPYQEEHVNIDGKVQADITKFTFLLLDMYTFFICVFTM